MVQVEPSDSHLPWGKLGRAVCSNPSSALYSLDDVFSPQSTLSMERRMARGSRGSPALAILIITVTVRPLRHSSRTRAKIVARAKTVDQGTSCIEDCPLSISSRSLRKVLCSTNDVSSLSPRLWYIDRRCSQLISNGRKTKIRPSPKRYRKKPLTILCVSYESKGVQNHPTKPRIRCDGQQPTTD